MKTVVAVLVVALIAVIGLIVMTDRSARRACPTPRPQEDAQETTAALDTGAGSHRRIGAGSDDAAQDTMYEGALAGLSEEEIAKMALAEEESGERQRRYRRGGFR